MRGAGRRDEAGEMDSGHDIIIFLRISVVFVSIRVFRLYVSIRIASILSIHINLPLCFYFSIFSDISGVNISVRIRSLGLNFQSPHNIYLRNKTVGF